MCTLSWIRQLDGYHVFFNRDERRTRAAGLPPEPGERGGVTWLAVAFTGSLAAAFAQGAAPFILIDLVKAAAAAMILPQVWKVAGRSKPLARR